MDAQVGLEGKEVFFGTKVSVLMTSLMAPPISIDLSTLVFSLHKPTSLV